jgi:hypothetical protein
MKTKKFFDILKFLSELAVVAVISISIYAIVQKAGGSLGKHPHGNTEHFVTAALKRSRPLVKYREQPFHYRTQLLRCTTVIAIPFVHHWY